MKWNSKFVRYALLGIAAVLLSLGLSFSTQKDINAANGTYKILAWNDLGMHCYNRDFSNLAVLPPYNNLWVQVIQAGDPPKMVTSGITVSYSYADNTYSVGKTNFWTYAKALFGATLADNVGLKGKGLSGTLDLSGDHYVAEGIPLTEFSDSAPTVRQPYQVATVVVKDSTTGAVLATQSVVTPTSSEMRCDNCHSDTGRAHPQKLTGKVETNILQFHDEQSGTHLMTSQPVLCASCHSSNALGAPGKSGIKSLSNAMHETHSEEIPNTLDGCYNCHPGPQTRCLRDVMSQTKGMTCVDCHGTMSKVSQNTSPWLNEPRCDTCHNNGKFNQNNALYRLSKDHGGLYCEACHDSTHAVAPSREAADAIKFIALQGKNGPISTCTVCHTTPPAGNLGPHGTSFTPTDTVPPTVLSITRASANPTSAATVNFTVTFSEAVTGVDAADFSLAQTGLTGVTIANVAGSGAVYTVTASTGAGAGSLRLDLIDNDSILDLAGNPLGGTGAGNGNFTSGDTYTIITPLADIAIGGVDQGAFSLPRFTYITKNFAGLTTGPVRVTSNDGSPIFTSQRATSGENYNEVMGVPTSQLTTDYWFPAYDHSFISGTNTNPMRMWVLVGNASTTQAATVNITIGNTLMAGSPFSIPAGGRITPRWIGTKGGPVHVVSTNGVIIFTSERVFTYPNNSFNEILGLPANQLTSEYWFPYYDSTSMSNSIQVSNTSNTLAASVDIYVGATKKSTDSIPAHSSITRSYPNLVGGPVRVVSTNGVQVVTSQTTTSGPNNAFNEVMGYPFNQFTTDYWFPIYDHSYNPGVNTNLMRMWVLVGNPSATLAATVDIYIAGVKTADSPFSIPAGGRITPRWIGTTNGPVEVLSTNGVPIFTSERVLTNPNSVFNEMMGYPANQLSNTYWFPYYDSVSMSNDILVGRP